jgi:hypothetical protein
MIMWIFGLYGGKGTCKNISTPTLKSVLGRGNKEYEIGGANISYIGIDVW